MINNWNVQSFHLTKIMVSLVAEFTSKLEPAYSSIPMKKTGRVSQVENPC